MLFIGLLVSLAVPTLTRRAALFAQGFALLRVCVGLFTIAIGIGPRTVIDVVIHATMLALLIGGLVITARQPAGVPLL